MKNKDKYIKSLVFMGATMLVLVVATVAWFITGNADTDDFNGDVDLGQYSAVYYESPDEDKDGLLDTPAVWNEMSGPSIDIASMVPGEQHFYRIDVTVYDESIDLQFFMSGIDAVIAPGSTATKSDIYSRVNMYFETKDSLNNPIPGTPVINDDMLALLGSPAETEIIIYDMDLTDYTNSTFAIYYTVGIPAGHTVADDAVQGSSVQIGSIDFIATNN